MSFTTTGEIIDRTEQALTDAQRWVEASQAEHPDSPELLTGLALAKKEIIARRTKVREILAQHANDARDVRLQFGEPVAIENAARHLNHSHVNSVESLREAVGSFFDETSDALATCRESANGTPAESVFSELRSEFESSASHLVWSLRPNDDSPGGEDSLPDHDTATRHRQRNPSGKPPVQIAHSGTRSTIEESSAESVTGKIKHLMEPEEEPIDKKNPWLPFGTVALAYVAALIVAIVAGFAVLSLL